MHVDTEQERRTLLKSILDCDIGESLIRRGQHTHGWCRSWLGMCAHSRHHHSPGLKSRAMTRDDRPKDIYGGVYSVAAAAGSSGFELSFEWVFGESADKLFELFMVETCVCVCLWVRIVCYCLSAYAILCWKNVEKFLIKTGFKFAWIGDRSFIQLQGTQVSPFDTVVFRQQIICIPILFSDGIESCATKYTIICLASLRYF